MISSFEQEISKLRTRIIKMGSLVDEQVDQAFRSLNKWDLELAREVMERDSKVDRYDFKIEKQCQRIFALQQPVARDLRLIMAAMKINSELERMGDLAYNVARSVPRLYDFREKIASYDLEHITDAVQRMVRMTIDSFVNYDPKQALGVLRSDPKVDQVEVQIGRRIVEAMKDDPEFIQPGVELVIQLRNMERLADHATNIAEDVIFFTKAEIIRNRFDADAFRELQRRFADEHDEESIDDDDME